MSTRDPDHACRFDVFTELCACGLSRSNWVEPAGHALPTMLFLDDERWRHALADDRYAGRYRVQHAYTLQDALAQLDQRRFDVVSTDHDLENEVAGYEMCAALVSLPRDRRPSLVIVHSWNVQAAEGVATWLKREGMSCREEMFEAPEPGSELAREAGVSRDQMPRTRESEWPT